MSRKYNNSDSKNTPLGGLGVYSNNISAQIKSRSFIQYQAAAKRSSGLTNIFEIKASPWGSLVGLLFFILLSSIATAQPLPPTTPSGNPVPVDGGLMLLVAALAGLGIVKFRKQKQ
jgi:hypothetical protein